MKIVQQQLFALVRAGLWGAPTDMVFFPSRPDWESICAQAARQTVSGLVATATFPPALRPPLCIKNRLRNITIATIRSHALLNRTLVELIDRFRQHGIYPVLLKGQGVASNYIEPTLRICGDIDLYIGKQDYDRACRLAKSWIINTDNEHGEESEKHYHFKYGVVTVELHRLAEQLSLPWQNARFQVWTQKHLHGAHLRSIVIEATVISLPPVNFDALYIFEHAWHHLIDGMGVGLRQLCDWVRYLYCFHDEINRKELEMDLKAFGLWRPWQIFGPIAVGVLGLPVEMYPFYTDRYSKQSVAILEMIERGGNFGFFDASLTQRPQGYISGKLHSLARRNTRFGKLLFIAPKEILIGWSHFLYVGVKTVISDKLHLS